MCHDECQSCNGVGGRYSGGTVGGKFIVCAACHGAGYLRVDTDATCPFPPGSKQKIAALRARWETNHPLFYSGDFIDAEHHVGSIPKGMVAV